MADKRIVLVLLIEISLTQFKNNKEILIQKKVILLVVLSSFFPLFWNNFPMFCHSIWYFLLWSILRGPHSHLYIYFSCFEVFRTLPVPPSRFPSAVWSFSLLPVVPSSLALSAVGVFNYFSGLSPCYEMLLFIRLFFSSSLCSSIHFMKIWQTKLSIPVKIKSAFFPSSSFIL